MVWTCRCHVRNAPRAIVLGLVDDVVEVVTDLVHQHLAVQVQVDIVGLTASADLGDHRQGEAVAARSGARRADPR